MKYEKTRSIRNEQDVGPDGDRHRHQRDIRSDMWVTESPLSYISHWEMFTYKYFTVQICK